MVVRYSRRQMPQDKEKQRGRTSIVDGETPSQSSGLLNPPRKLTAVACVDCRKRKRKCNGERPSCSACQTRGLSCIYDVIEGATRTEDLKHRVQSLTIRARKLESFVNKLRYSTDNEASAMLAQLRLGDSVDVILAADGVIDGMSEFGESERKGSRRHSRDQGSQSLQTMASLGSGLLAQNKLGAPWPPNLGTYDSTHSERSMSVTTDSPSVFDGHDTGKSRQDRPDSSWAAPLFIEVDSQHLLFDEDSWLEPQSAIVDGFPMLDGVDGESSTNSPYFHPTPQQPTWLDPTAPRDGFGTSSTASKRQTKLADRWRTRRHLLVETHGGGSVTVTSHLFSGVGNLPLSAPVKMQPSMQDVTAPAWAVVSTYRDDGQDMMSRVYIDFINENKRLIADGMPPEQLFGPFPDVDALLSETAFQRASSLSRWTARLANSFGIPSMVCRLAVMWLQWHLTRWLIHPTPETYTAIPEWYRPTPYQVVAPHPIYADFHIWPHFRDVLIQRVDLQSHQRYWFSESAKTIDCNWPGAIQDAVYYDGMGRTTLRPEFVQHILDLGSWTIGPVIRKHIPDADLVLQIKYGPI